MKYNFSLKQSWTILVIFSSTVPVIIVMLWYAQKIYTDQISSYLSESHQANELLSSTIDGELQRIKILLHYEANSINQLLDLPSKPKALIKMNSILSRLKVIEPSFAGIFIVSKKEGLISAVDPSMGFKSETLLQKDNLTKVAKHHNWEVEDFEKSQELFIPLSGKDYISEPIVHTETNIHITEINFFISVPIGNPARAVLICEINIDSLWDRRLDIVTNYETKDPLIVDYILNKKGELISRIEGTNYNLGMLMKGLNKNILLHKKEHHHGEWSHKDSYIGILYKPVFSTITTVVQLDWTIVSEVLVSTVTTPITKELITITLSIIVGISLFVWFILVLAKKTISPIQEVCKALELISKNQFKKITKTSGIHELDILSTGFNDMALKRNEDEKYQKQIVDELENKNAELERFTYTVSHDLKSPLVTISGFIGLLIADIEKKDAKRINNDLTVIQKAVTDMQTLLNDLLALSRIGRKVVPHTSIESYKIIEKVLTLLTSQIESCNAEISIDNSLPIIKVEESRFKEVFLNLIENSIKYRQENLVPQINIGVTTDNKNAKYIFYIQDNGIGVDPRYKERVFDLFERLNNTSDGSGIGLAIVKRIIEVHHGSIWLESKGVGFGTKIFFTVPIPVD